MSPEIASEVSAPPREARRLGVLLVVGSLLLVLIGTIGARNPWALVWVERLFHHTFVFGVLAALGFFFGLAVLVPALRGLFWVAGLTVAVIWAILSAYASAWNSEPVIDTVPAPDGTPLELVVRSSTDNLIEPAWVFEIRQTGTPSARYWEFGCMSGERSINGYESARWESPSQLIIQAASGETITMTVNPRTGEPVEPPGDPWNCLGWN
jgi:hypothetical protein